MSNRTNDGWPDPSDWARRLFNELEELGSEYMAAPWTIPDDPDELAGLSLKQDRASRILVAAAAALHELPPFKDSKGAAALHDMAAAMHEVVSGGMPRLFKSARKAVPGGGDGIDRNYVKAHVVLACRFMIDAHGWKDTDARRLVAEKFAQAGALGRKGNPLSKSTVQDWCEKAHPLSTDVEGARIHREVDLRLSKLKMNPDWPGSLDSAYSWIERLASNPLVSSKYG